MKLELFKISELKLDPENARRHNAKNLAAISKSFDEFDQLKNIVVDKNNVVIAGNGTVQTFIDKGKTEIWGVRSPLSPAKNKAFALADNRTAELAEWDTGNLQKTLDALRAADIDLGSVGFEPADLNDLNLAPKNEGLIEDDAVPEIAQNIHGVKLGDIWQLGEHRVMCGDSTKKEDVERLMAGEKADMVFTDPPYGVAVENGQGSIAGDETLECFEKSIPMLKNIAKEATHFYVWCASGDNLPPSIHAFSKHIPFQNLLPIRATHENKRGPKGAFKLNYEACLFGNNNSKGFNSSKKFPVSETTINDERYKGDGFLKVYPALWDGERATEHNMNIVHPTQKKVEMIEFYVEISSNTSEVVADLFLGSGSTLIACEKTNRKCYGMEIDPHYCSVIIERWQQFTGKKAELITT